MSNKTYLSWRSGPRGLTAKEKGAIRATRHSIVSDLVTILCRSWFSKRVSKRQRTARWSTKRPYGLGPEGRRIARQIGWGC